MFDHWITCIKLQVTYDLDRNHLLYKYQFLIGKINIIKELKHNLCLSHDHHPLNICMITIESIDRLLFIIKTITTTFKVSIRSAL